MSNTIENEKIWKAYDKIIEKENLSEARKGVRRKLQLLDDRIDDFMDDLKKEIDKIEDNPIYQKNMYQLLADTTKEHSEFWMALKRVAASLDNGSNVIPKTKGSMRPNQNNFGNDQEEPEKKEDEQKNINELFGRTKDVPDPNILMKSIMRSLQSAFRAKDPVTFFTILDDMIKHRKRYMKAIKSYGKMNV